MCYGWITSAYHTASSKHYVLRVERYWEWTMMCTACSPKDKRTNWGDSQGMLHRLGLMWEETQAAAVDKRVWRRSVAQYVQWMQTESKSRSLTNWVRNFTDNWLRFDFTKRRAYRRPHFTPSFVTFTSDLLSKSMVTEDGYAYCWANGAYTQFKLCDILFLNTHGWLRNTDVHLVTLIF